MPLRKRTEFKSVFPTRDGPVTRSQSRKGPLEIEVTRTVNSTLRSYLLSEGFRERPEQVFCRKLNDDLTAWILLTTGNRGKLIRPSTGIACQRINLFCSTLQSHFPLMEGTWSDSDPVAVFENLRREDRLHDDFWRMPSLGEDRIEDLIASLEVQERLYFSQFSTLEDVGVAIKDGAMTPHRIVWLGPAIFGTLGNNQDFDWMVQTNLTDTRLVAAEYQSHYRSYADYLRKKFNLQ